MKQIPLPTRRRVAEYAYELFVNRGATHGRDLDDWLQAEKALFDEFFGEPEKRPRQRRKVTSLSITLCEERIHHEAGAPAAIRHSTLEEAKTPI